MATFISHSPAETERLGEDWGRAAVSGWVIGLSGDLGAGKTQLVKGLARGLGIPARVHSPTFALVNIYEGGRLVLFHLDLYRLDTLEQIVSAGLEDYLQPRGVAVIEWADRWFGPQLGVSPKSTVHSPQSTIPGPPTPTVGSSSHCPQVHGQVFRVHLETLSETMRRITYEDPGA